MSIDKKAAQTEIDEMKARMAELERIINEPDEVVPWVPKLSEKGWRRWDPTPGVYQVNHADIPSTAPGYSKTEAQAERRALLDKQLDILWGLKITLEPDWEPDWGSEKFDKYYVVYNYSFSKWFNRSNSVSKTSAVLFSLANARKVVDYLNKHYPHGIKL